jgi:hypothetical protein
VINDLFTPPPKLWRSAMKKLLTALANGLQWLADMIRPKPDVTTKGGGGPGAPQ